MAVVGGGRDTGQERSMAMASLGQNRVCGSILKCSVLICVYFYNFMLSPLTTALVAEKLGGLGEELWTWRVGELS